ncbi:MAG: Uma2 family endonuclease [Oscillatoriales cyanobacterium]|nr:MAG: Uma2 family endonuclease [Oscillatoriales cyanobacterium]TAH25303.1 MAG: Uma2 family endonuclease [Oscillatoriales cyanobacterium]
MTQTLLQPLEQRFIHSGISWQQFKLIQQGFSDSPGIRLFYYRGEVEILAVSEDHEAISRTLTILLALYFDIKDIEFKPTGSRTLETEGEASTQADESYLIGRSTGTPPDLSVEIIFTSGTVKKLQRYRVLGVPEVWFWEDGVLAMYRLGAEGYEKISSSVVLPDLDINLLCRCLLMASSVEAMREFRRGISG